MGKVGGIPDGSLRSLRKIHQRIKFAHTESKLKPALGDACGEWAAILNECRSGGVQPLKEVMLFSPAAVYQAEGAVVFLKPPELAMILLREDL